ncbi:MAG: universal stress protein, partial [Ardenticatenaceae bacterium]
MASFVMVPLDGSALAEEALPLAVTLAQRIKRGLLLVQVVPRPSLSYISGSEVTPLELADAFR